MTAGSLGASSVAPVLARLLPRGLGAKGGHGAQAGLARLQICPHMAAVLRSGSAASSACACPVWQVCAPRLLLPLQCAAEGKLINNWHSQPRCDH